MHQSRTLDVGMDGHTESIAVASVAKEHDAEVLSLGTLGTRQCDLDPLMRQRPAKATPLVFVSAAGPCGSWLSRYRAQKDDGCWVVAPSCMPNKAGDRVTTDRRDARPLARLMRAGDLPPVYEQNPQSARRNNFPGEQISRWFLLLSEDLSASNYPGAAHTPSFPTSPASGDWVAVIHTPALYNTSALLSTEEVCRAVKYTH
jgi:hypothetical protein